ncbi:MAG: hypothetical protein L0Z62_41695, partial [Gemmataceae bacterium]|nr:hypothetical protein [Gemmataceae bacterium]
MARDRTRGSLTKEFPLDSLDRTILAIRPGWSYDQLRRFASDHTNSGIPALLRHRYLLVDAGQIVYDRFLSLLHFPCKPMSTNQAGQA